MGGESCKNLPDMGYRGEIIKKSCDYKEIIGTGKLNIFRGREFDKLSTIIDGDIVEIYPHNTLSLKTPTTDRILMNDRKSAILLKGKNKLRVSNCFASSMRYYFNIPNGYWLEDGDQFQLLLDNYFEEVYASKNLMKFPQNKIKNGDIIVFYQNGVPYHAFRAMYENNGKLVYYSDNGPGLFNTKEI